MESQFALQLARARLLLASSQIYFGPYAGLDPIYLPKFEAQSPII